MNVPSALNWAFPSLLLLFLIFKLTIEISMRRIILEMEYLMTSMIYYQMLKFSKRIASFYREMILRPLFCFEDTKIQVY